MNDKMKKFLNKETSDKKEEKDTIDIYEGEIVEKVNKKIIVESDGKSFQLLQE